MTDALRDQKTLEEGDPKCVVVLGTGDFGRAIASHLQKRGYYVIIGSRNPDKYRDQLPSFRIMETSEAVRSSRIICLAIPVEGYTLLDVSLFHNKIVIDVSNRRKAKKTSKISQAEMLQKHLVNSKVVKAFNTISAYALLTGQFQGSKEVPICSNHSNALSEVSQIVRKLGFIPIEQGDLSVAQSIEDIPMAFFSEWRNAFIMGIIFWICDFIYIVFRRDICPIIDGDEWDFKMWSTIPMDEFGCSLGHTALFLLTSCYLPGVVASYIQLFRGTKYSRFPNWLDRWLKMRKYAGVMALLVACYHAIMGVVLESDFWDYYFWRSHLFIFCGATALTSMSILGVTSLPSVGATLTWREFSFLHRHLGWWAVFVITFHIIFLSWDALITDQFRCIFLPHENQIMIFYPLIALALKAPLMLPCVNWHLQKIRRGYERRPQSINV